MAPNPARKAGQSQGASANDINKNKKGTDYKKLFPTLFVAIKNTLTAPSWTDLGIYIGLIMTKAEMVTVQTHKKDKETKKVEALTKPVVKINKLSIGNFLGQLDIAAGHSTKKCSDLLEDPASDIRKGILLGWSQYQVIQKDLDLNGSWDEVILPKIKKDIKDLNSKEIKNLYTGIQKLTIENGTPTTQKKAKPQQRDQVKKLVSSYRGNVTKGSGMTKEAASKKALEGIGIIKDENGPTQPTDADRLTGLLTKMSVEEIQNAIRAVNEEHQITIYEKLDQVTGVDELASMVS